MLKTAFVNILEGRVCTRPSLPQAAVPLGLLLATFFWGWPQAEALEVPPLTGRVVDQAHLLSAEVSASLSADLAEHERRTGNQVVVLTLPSLEGEPLEEFSHRVATTWKLGRKGTDNGVLLLVVQGERKIRIEVGYGLEGTLTDAVSARIIRGEMVPRFRSGDIAGGIAAGAKAIIGTIEGTYTAPEPFGGQAPQGGGLSETFVLAVLVGALAGAFVGMQHHAMGAGVGGLLAFVIALSLGLLLAIAASAAGLLGALLLSSLFRGGGGLRRAASSDGWLGGGGTGWGGGGFGGSDSGGGFSGGGGDFGGGGASGSW